MGTLANILKRVFTEGVEAVPKRQLESLFQASRKDLSEAGTQKLFRKDVEARDLMERGFDTELMKNPPLLSELDEWKLAEYYGSMNKPNWEEARKAIRRGLNEEEVRHISGNIKYESGEPVSYEDMLSDLYDEPGLYWSAGSLKGIPRYQKKGEIIEGLIRPEAKVTYEGLKNWTEPEKQPDFWMREGVTSEHFVQKHPGNVLAKLGDKYRILGLAGALGAGGGLASAMGEPEEAEAGLFEDAMKRTIKRMAKRATKTAVEEAGTVTSSAKVLTGKELEGKIVKTVKSSGNENWRHVVFEDGSEKAYPKDTISSLCRNIGTRAYAQMLEEKDAPSQLSQALNSLTYHEQRQRTFTTKRMLDDYLKIHQSRLKEMGQEPEPMTYITAPFRGYIPSMYVPILKDAGRIKLPTKKVTE